MRLFSKIALTLSLTAVASSLAAISTVSAIVIPQYEGMDRKAAQEAMTRVYGVFQRELDVSRSHAGDWGNWDDTYVFAKDFNKAYVEANLTSEALTTIGVTELIIADMTGTIVANHLADPDAKPEQAPFTKSARLPASLWPAPDKLTPRNRVASIISTPHGPAIAAFTRITDSKFEKVSDRILVLVKPIDQTFRKMVAEQSGYKFTLKPSGKSATQQGNRVVLKNLGERGYEASYPVPGPDGTISYMLEVRTPATFKALASETMKFLALLLMLIGLTTGVALVLFMRRVVAKPIEKLISHSQRIARTGDLDTRLHVSSDDEIGLLAGAYNTMLAQLKQARLQIQEMSYASGMANTAADVLHNIRNTLGPIATTLWKGREAVKDLATANLMRAGEELASPQADSERRAKLSAYVTATARHFEKRRLELDADLRIVQDFAAQIEDVLRHHEASSKAERLIEPVPVTEIVETAATQVSRTSSIPVQIAVVGDLLKIPPVLAQRVVLRQIIENLVVNAVQSIEQQKPEDARVTFSAQCTGEKVEITIADNGAGIPSQDLTRIFERGVSTKGERGRGLGLHFCATNMRAMNGEISVESAGPGRGATFSVRLPKSVTKGAAA